MPDFSVLITDGLEENGQSILRNFARVDNFPDIAPEKLLEVIPDYDALIIRGRTKVTEQVFKAAKNLRVVGRAGVGVDNIDLESAKAHGVVVVNAPVSTTLAVAELTFGLMLSLARNIPRADAGTKQGQWLKRELKGIELNSRTLGIIGVGRIGAELCKRAAAFDMRVLGYDPYISAEEISQRGAQPASLSHLYDQADYISLHLPLTEETRSMLNEQAFRKMKHGVRIVCAARGGIINESALLAALDSGQVAGAALDVFDTEPPGANALVKHPNLIATPHIGAQTEEAQSRAAEDIANEVLAGLQKKPLRWKVG
jgi:D-3-phosphoglycerate dehydrogenase / 2-oxoglutarate reductase